MALLRHRYMVALSSRARGLLKSMNPAPPAVSARPAAPPLPRRPCSGPTCSRARAAGLASGYAVGSYARCAACRRDTRLLAAAAYLHQLLGPHGSPSRRDLLYPVAPLSKLCASISQAPHLKGAPLAHRDALRVLALAGVPHLDCDGRCQFPGHLPEAPPAVPPPPARPAGQSTCCGSTYPRLTCAGCAADFCDPSPNASEAPRACRLHAAYAPTPGAEPWLCPDCRQFFFQRAASSCSAASGSAQSPQVPSAKSHMNALAAAPRPYPSASASLCASVVADS